ncbi:hypothetical protein J6590_076768 [Homalodisca vitripennis]|nr:hypothetical protein J6590_076768 [Homalodisca vitripennis]
MPKTRNVSKRIVESAAAEAISEFNFGNKVQTGLMEGLKRQDELRIFEAEKAMKDIEKKQKKSEKQ